MSPPFQGHILARHTLGVQAPPHTAPTGHFSSVLFFISGGVGSATDYIGFPSK